MAAHRYHRRSWLDTPMQPILGMAMFLVGAAAIPAAALFLTGAAVLR